MPILEKKVKDYVKRILKDAGAYQHWPVQSGYGAACLDCHGCYEGLYFAIETKAPGKRPTPRQLMTIEAVQNAGGMTFVIGEYKQGDHVGGPGTGIIVEDKFSGIGDLCRWLDDNAPS